MQKLIIPYVKAPTSIADRYNTDNDIIRIGHTIKAFVYHLSVDWHIQRPDFIKFDMHPIVTLSALVLENKSAKLRGCRGRAPTIYRD